MDKTDSLLKLARIDVIQTIPGDDYVPVLTSAPFISVDGTFNTRDLGLVPNSPLRAGYAFRSGGLDRLTDRGMEAIKALGIKRIFDLRSPKERSRAPDPEIPGVQNTWIQSSRPDAKPDLNSFISGVGECGYQEVYLEVMDIYQAAWKAILQHVRDRPLEPFLFHCTAGRDRTGVIAGMLLSLAGAPSRVVSLDYMLSRIGTEPVRGALLEFAMAGTGCETISQPGFYNFCQLREESWDAFVQGVQKEYGGFEGFVTNRLGISAEDLASIKSNLIQDTPHEHTSL